MAATKKVKGTLALASLILNMAIPGVGSLVAEKKNEGTWQLILFILGVILLAFPTVMGLGALFWLIAWVWSVLITSVKLVKQAD